MIKNNIFVAVSIFCIRSIWHGKLGRKYNGRKGILCRFYPSCSNYAIMALEKYGFIKGWQLAYRRLKRCNQSNTESCIDYP
ncbi:membrane protein insertion efficiency factor YidD [Methanoregula sp. UBA64]|uniref:membrane protein insertion efficiency factor YidD n=1 Tax=Methanoregula sp. UBA64 TaxID=1915554 RepID=UPI0032E40BC0